MREKDLKLILQQPFQFETWKALLPMLFKKVEYLSRPESLFTEYQKVIKGKQVGRIKLDDDKSLAIFDAFGLTDEEHKEVVYWATAELVKQRLDKAGSR